MKSENYHDAVVSFADDAICIYLPKRNSTLAFRKCLVLQIHCFSLNSKLKSTHTLVVHFWFLAFGTGKYFKEGLYIQMQALYEVIFLLYEAY